MAKRTTTRRAPRMAKTKAKKQKAKLVNTNWRPRKKSKSHHARNASQRAKEPAPTVRGMSRELTEPPDPKAKALKALAERKKHPPEHIDNSRLCAGSPMYFYCHECGHTAEVCPESYTWRPKQFCDECQDMKDKGWL